MVKTTGLNVLIGQGDLKEKIAVFGSTVVAGDYEPIKDMLESSGEVAVYGFNERKVITPTPVITQGTAAKMSMYNLILQREGAKTVYVKVPMPDDKTKAQAVANAFLNKMYGGFKIVNVSREATNEKLAG